MLRKWYNALTPLGRFYLHALASLCICAAISTLAISLVNARMELRALRDNPCIQHEQQMRDAVNRLNTTWRMR